MGESKDRVLRPDFDRRLKLEFHGSRVTSDAGSLPYRELDDAVGLTEIAGDGLTDTRRGKTRLGKNGRHGLVGLFRQSVFG
ncbi:MAG: transposase, partial [Proteobacteria bacterium]|nr:transposase [Pseudomonadota bacterium]